MGVEKKVLKDGNGQDTPKKGDMVSMEYTGWLYQPNSGNDNKGEKFDSSVGRGDFKVAIGEGKVIKGWDEGILGNASNHPMTLGEKSTLTITSDYAYGQRGFPGHIPPGATLVFDVELKAINSKSA